MIAARRIVAFGALWLAVGAGTLLAPGCYGRNCEGGIEVFGVDAGQGEMVTPDRWASNPFEGQWLWFPRQRLYFFEVPELGGRTPDLILPYVSASPEPGKTNGDLTIGAGNIALISGIGSNRVAVKNDTCSDYYLRLVLEAPPFPPAVPDAGIADAAPDDAEAGP